MCSRASLRGCLLLLLLHPNAARRLRGYERHSAGVAIRLLLHAIHDTGSAAQRGSQLTIILHIPPCIA
jgi:hypothetical protein